MMGLGEPCEGRACSSTSLTQLGADPPSVLVVIAGLGHADRLRMVAQNMRRIQVMADHGSVAATCLAFVFATELALPSSALSTIPLCQVRRQTGGLLHHLLSVPEADLVKAEFVFVMVTSVVLTADVSLRMLVRIMRANELDWAGPACDTCKTKRTINHDYSGRFGVGRRVPMVDLQATMFRNAAFRCLQRLGNQTIEVDRFMWASLNIYRRFCSRHARFGVVDAMSIHKASSGARVPCGWMMLDPHRISSGVRVSFSHLGPPLVLRRRDRVRQQEASCPAGG